MPLPRTDLPPLAAAGVHHVDLLTLEFLRDELRNAALHSPKIFHRAITLPFAWLKPSCIGPISAPAGMVNYRRPSGIWTMTLDWHNLVNHSGESQWSVIDYEQGLDDSGDDWAPDLERPSRWDCFIGDGPSEALQNSWERLSSVLYKCAACLSGAELDIATQYSDHRWIDYLYRLAAERPTPLLRIGHESMTMLHVGWRGKEEDRPTTRTLGSVKCLGLDSDLATSSMAALEMRLTSLRAGDHSAEARPTVTSDSSGTARGDRPARENPSQREIGEGTIRKTARALLHWLGPRTSSDGLPRAHHAELRSRLSALIVIYSQASETDWPAEVREGFRALCESIRVDPDKAAFLATSVAKEGGEYHPPLPVDEMDSGRVDRIDKALTLMAGGKTASPQSAPDQSVDNLTCPEVPAPREAEGETTPPSARTPQHPQTHEKAARADERTLTFLPGAFVYRNRQKDLSGFPLAILQALSEAQGKTLTLRAIMDKVWGDAVVGEESVRSHIKAARNALREVMREVGVSGPADPLPCVARGANRTAWRLDLP